MLDKVTFMFIASQKPELKGIWKAKLFSPLSHLWLSTA
jgi:hypothetical protein